MVTLRLLELNVFPPLLFLNYIAKTLYIFLEASINGLHAEKERMGFEELIKWTLKLILSCCAFICIKFLMFS